MILKIKPLSKRAKDRLGTSIRMVELIKLSDHPLTIGNKTFEKPMLIKCGDWFGWMCGEKDIDVLT